MSAFEEDIFLLVPSLVEEADGVGDMGAQSLHGRIDQVEHLWSGESFQPDVLETWIDSVQSLLNEGLG